MQLSRVFTRAQFDVKKGNMVSVVPAERFVSHCDWNYPQPTAMVLLKFVGDCALQCTEQPRVQ
jgi:hypothetical protein